MCMLSVMCCGCFRCLGADGSTLGKRHVHGALLDLSFLSKVIDGLEGAKPAEFADKAAADESAVKSGWSVKDEDGTPNHRCPRCRRKVESAERPKRQGAYIDLEARRVLP